MGSVITRTADGHGRYLPLHVVTDGYGWLWMVPLVPHGPTGGQKVLITLINVVQRVPHGPTWSHVVPRGPTGGRRARPLCV